MTTGSSSDAVAALRALAESARVLLDVDGAAISVFAGGRARVRVTASDEWAARLDELEFEVGEGPCYDAYSRNVLVEADIDEEPASYPVFAKTARAAGVRRMMAYPLPSASGPVGVLDLLRRRPRGFTDHEQQVAAHLQALAAEGLRRLGDEVDDEVFEHDALASYRWQVHQAVGVLRAREGLDAAAALAQLRARAFAEDTELDAVARAVVESTGVAAGPDPGGSGA